MVQRFPLLFTPFELGKYTLQSRIVMTGHGTGFYDEANLPTEDYGYYLRERAKGGAGLVALGECTVHPSDTTPHMTWDDRIIGRYRRIAELVHEFDVPVIAQLAHGGANAAIHQRQALDGDWLSWAPSALPIPTFANVQAMPHEMTTEEVEELVAAYRAGAERIRAGGIDGSEIQIGFGFLISQFLHGYSNRRTDKYGGATLEERMTFPYEVLRAVRDGLGPDLLLGARIIDDMVDYSIDYEDVKTIARLVEATGLVDWISVTVGSVPEPYSYRSIMPTYYHQPGQFTDRSAGIKELVKLPVIGIGRINSPALAEQLLEEGRLDLVGMVRELIADPQLPNKAREGRVPEIRRCLACDQSCIGRIEKNLSVRCIYNPVTGHEKEWADLGSAPASKKVVVVGGGPAGMEAARVAAERGHQVVLFEASERLGGQVKLVILTPMRDSFEEIILFFEEQLPRLGVDVRLNTEATADTVLAESPDAVIVATGSTAYVPDVPGGDGRNVVTVNDVMSGRETGENVVMVDTQGTPAGCTVAEYLADRGKRVEIVTGLKFVGSDINRSVWHNLYERLVRKGVVMSPMTGVAQIDEDSVDVYNVVHPLATRTIESVDTVVMAGGGQANTAIYDSLRGRVKELHIVGDCAQPRDIEMATYTGHRVAVAL